MSRGQSPGRVWIGHLRGGASRGDAQLVEVEPRWSDDTILLEVLLDVRAGVQRLHWYFEEGDDEEEVPEEDA